MSQAEALLERAIARGVMIATAESCTAGLIAGAITEVPGSSAIFDRGFVTYSNAAKIAMLGVQQATLEAHGAVSEEIAIAMAQGALARIRRREVPPDIAHRQSTIDRIRQRMHADIRIRMPNQPGLMRHRNAA